MHLHWKGALFMAHGVQIRMSGFIRSDIYSGTTVVAISGDFSKFAVRTETS